MKKKTKRKYAAQKKNILVWEDKQRAFWFMAGLLTGIVLGSWGVFIIYL